MKYLLSIIFTLLFFSGCQNSDKETLLNEIQFTINNIEETKECILNTQSSKELIKCNEILELNKENKVKRNIKLPDNTSMLQYKIFKMLDNEENDLKNVYICINEAKTKKDILKCQRYSNILEIK